MHQTIERVQGELGQVVRAASPGARPVRVLVRRCQLWSSSSTHSSTRIWNQRFEAGLCGVGLEEVRLVLQPPYAVLWRCFPALPGRMASW